MTDPLDMTIDHTRDDLRRADATAGALVFFILGLGSIVAEIGADLPRGIAIAVTFAAIPAVVTVGCALAVVRPRMIDNGDDPAAGSWPHSSRQSGGPAVLAALDAADPREIKSQQGWSLSLIAKAKNAWVPRAVKGFAVTSLYLAAVAIVGALVALF
jgi:hypothetical protein